MRKRKSRHNPVIQDTIRRQGQVYEWIAAHYGPGAFSNDQTLKKTINKAIRWVKENEPIRNQNHILDGLLEARSLQQYKDRYMKKNAKKHQRKNPKTKKWEQGAVKHPGRVEALLMEFYGPKAFYANGDIKLDYLQDFIDELKEDREDHGYWAPGELSEYRALILARTFIEQSHKKGKKKHKGRKTRYFHHR